LFHNLALIAVEIFFFFVTKKEKIATNSRLKLLKMVEIERKFLVTSEEFKTEAFTHNRIAQGYLSAVPGRTVRVRIKGNKGFLTIKGASNESGLSRFEWEKEITLDDATALLKLCEEGIIDKTRFEVKKGNHVFEIDEFYGENQGLIMAEIELNSETETFEKPIWLGKEGTNYF
jgi:adenylate cyclase